MARIGSHNSGNFGNDHIEARHPAGNGEHKRTVRGFSPRAGGKDILDIIWNIPEVKGIHDLKTRRLGPHIAVSVHIMLEGGMTLNRAHDITVQLERDFKRRFGPHSIITIHMEPADSRRLSKSYPKPEEKES